MFDVARRAAAALVGLAEVVTEQPCFTYQASRDLTDFSTPTGGAWYVAPPVEAFADAD